MLQGIPINFHMLNRPMIMALIINNQAISRVATTILCNLILKADMAFLLAIIFIATM